jgi:hypothetical protein
MTRHEGFLVVRKVEDKVPGQYRGLFRMVPTSPPVGASGFEDPYVFGDLTDELGLSPSLDAAQTLVQRLAPVERSEDLEVLFVRTSSDDPPTTPTPPGAVRLGFDVAGVGGGFWSIVDDFPEGDQVARFRRQLNDNGLFDTSDAAAAYLDAYRRHRFADHNLPFAIWEVYRLP